MKLKLLRSYSIILIIFVSIPFMLSYADDNEVSWGYIFKNKEQTRETESKLGPRLRRAIQELDNLGVTRGNIAEKNMEEINIPNVKIDPDGYIQSYVFVEDLNEDIIEQLEISGMRVETSNDSYKVVQGWIPFYKFEEISAFEFVKKITTPDYAFPRTGSVNTEGDSVIMADHVREMFGITGAGVKVGVISDGIDNADSAQATNDLPDIIEINPFLPGSGDEGTALLEIIHDIAPGAELAFSGAATNLEFIDAVDFHVNHGVDVIIDDLGFLGEPFFEDGPVAESAISAVQDGVVFVSAAGNSAMRHYQNQYVDTNPEQSASEEDPAEDLHDFGLARGDSSDTTMSGLVAPGRSITIVLQWNDDSEGNTLDGSGNSSNDYDLIILENSPDLTCTPQNCISNDFQNGDDDPIEAIAVQNSNMSESRQFEILINRFSGQSKILEIYAGSFSAIQNSTPEDSVFGHPAATGVIAVGAVPSSDPDMVEDFSSRGPSTIYFPSFQERDKPDVVAPDNVSVTGAGGFPSPFSGTSAAAPHVAGVAALILEADPSLTPAELAAVLRDTAADLAPPSARAGAADPGPQNALFDNATGFGLVDALSAVQSVLPDMENSCDDQVDNDGDGSTDCADGDCSAHPVCTENCEDSIDNDNDGLVDCNDPDCGEIEECTDVAEICDDGIDNDEDNAIDCVDLQCQFDPACMMEEENDGDGESSGGCSLSETENMPAAATLNLIIVLFPLAVLYIFAMIRHRKNDTL